MKSLFRKAITSLVLGLTLVGIGVTLNSQSVVQNQYVASEDNMLLLKILILELQIYFKVIAKLLFVQDLFYLCWF